MKTYFAIAEAVISILLILTIVLQQRGSTLGSPFGGETSFYATRRGIQQKLFVATIVLAILFTVLAVLNLAF